LSRAAGMLDAGMSADALLAALSEHLRNLLILRVCGESAGLVESPAISVADLQKQAAKFDPTALTQDIALLEELRRQMRQGFGGRALLDATLVRLALAGQFVSIGQLLGNIDSASPHAQAEAQKKNGEGLRDRTEDVKERTEDGSTKLAAGSGLGIELKTAENEPQSSPPSQSSVLSSQSFPPPQSSPSPRLTQEITAELEQDPLVREIIQQLGGRIVKVD
jgi:DNA polymerase III gamma/tau subunit